MASDEHVTAALADFAKEVMRGSREYVGTGRILSLDQGAIRRRRLQELATEAEAMATNPRAATYRAFERSLREVQELGVQIESETIIRVASAFMQRPHVGLGKPGK
ncbi:MAG: hypothetical protein WA813_10240 [Beijerinckiaceae bacterium]